MERNSVLNLLFLLIFCLIMGGFFVVYGLEEPEAVYTAPVVVPAPVAPATPDWIVLENSGKSMEPWIPDGSLTHAYPADVPVVGDIVAFDCLSKKCAVHGVMLSHTKFLRGIDSRGCYYLVGREDRYFDGKEWTYSFDSTEYGYLCASDLKVLGVVRDLPEEGKH